MKKYLKKLYYAIFYPIFKALQKPILDELRQNRVDKTTILALEAFLRKEILPRYKILSPKESIAFLVKNKGSFIRMGDGDLPLLCDKGGGMHKFSQNLKRDLAFALDFALRNEIPIGINPCLVQRFDLANPWLFYACENLNLYGALKYLPNDKTYFDAICLRYSPMDFYLHESCALGGGRQEKFTKPRARKS